MAGITLWLDKGKGVMEKLNKPSKPARICKLKTNDWYIVWYSGGNRCRAKLGLNRIKDLELRKLWAERIVDFINGELLQGIAVSENDIPSALIPPPHDDAPSFVLPKFHKKERMTFLVYFQKFIDLKRTEGVGEGWLTKLKTVLKSLRTYAADLGRVDFEFSELNRDWATAYKAWRYKKPREHGQNYVDKDFGIIRQVLKDADVESDDVEVNPKYKSKAFRVGTVLTDEIALTLAELKQIAALDLSGRKGYELVRDNFVVGCLTALRYSDWGFGTECIVEVDGRKMIRIAATEKTERGVFIPIHSLALTVLERYGFDMPVYSNQKSNSYMKEIAKLAGLCKVVSLKRSKGGKMIVVKKKQYEVVKTHTARRTFVTIALFEMKIPPQFIMKITGHKTEKQLFDYARVDGQFAAIEVAKVMEKYF